MSDPVPGNDPIPTEPAPVADPPVDPPPDPKPDEKTFTQAQLNRHAGTARAEGEKAALQKLATELGIPIEDVKAKVKAAQDAEDAQKTEMDKLRDQLEAAKRDAETSVKSVQEETYADKVQVRLVRAKLPQATIDDDESLGLITSLVKDKAPVGSTVEEIDNAIAVVKDKLPQLFAETTEPKNGNVPSNPSNVPKKAPINAPDAKAIGAKFAEEANLRRGVQPKTSAQ